jgi:hypothetical protein
MVSQGNINERINEAKSTYRILPTVGFGAFALRHVVMGNFVMMDPDSYFGDAERLWLERLAREHRPPRRALRPRARVYRGELLPGGCML